MREILRKRRPSPSIGHDSPRKAARHSGQPRTGKQDAEADVTTAVQQIKEGGKSAVHCTQGDMHLRDSKWNVSYSQACPIKSDCIHVCIMCETNNWGSVLIICLHRPMGSHPEGKQLSQCRCDTKKVLNCCGLSQGLGTAHQRFQLHCMKPLLQHRAWRLLGMSLPQHSKCWPGWCSNSRAC